MKFRFLFFIVILSIFIIFAKIFYAKNYIYLQDSIANVYISLELNKTNACHNFSALAQNTKMSLLYDGRSNFYKNFYDTNAASNLTPSHSLCQLQEINYPISHLFIKTDLKNLDILKSINLVIGNKVFVIKNFTNYIINEDSKKINTTNLDSKHPIIIDLSSFKYDNFFINGYSKLNIFIASLAYFLTFPAFFIFVIGLIFCYILTKRDCSKDFENIITLCEKKYILILITIVVLGGIFRFNGMNFYSLWGDEVYSAIVTSNPNLSLDSIFNDPGNPPFYFLLLKIWFHIFGFNEVIARSLSVVIGTIGIITIFIFAKKFTNIKTALLASLFYALSYQIIGASHEVRGYVLMLALAPLVANYFLLILKNFRLKDMILYFIFGSILANTHYYGCIFVFVNFIFSLFFWRWQNIAKILKFLALNILISLSLTPYIYITALKKAFLDSSFNTWIPHPSLNDLFLTPLNLIGSSIMFGIFILLIFYCLVLKNRFINYLIFIIFGCVFVPFVFSFLRPIYVPKYASAVIYPFILVFFAYAALNLNLKNGAKEIFFLFIIAAVLNTTLDSKVKFIGIGANYKAQLDFMNLDSKSYKKQNKQVTFLISSVVGRDEIRDISEFYSLDLKDDIILNTSHLPSNGVLYMDNYYSSQAMMSEVLQYYKNKTILKIPIDDREFVYKIVID